MLVYNLTFEVQEAMSLIREQCFILISAISSWYGVIRILERS